MNNVVSITAARKNRDLNRELLQEEHEYHARILAMDKLELLEEMVRFQEERTRVGQLTVQMMVRGKLLFRALETTAETDELRLLTRSYRRHLECELAEITQKSR